MEKSIQNTGDQETNDLKMLEKNPEELTELFKKISLSDSTLIETPNGDENIFKLKEEEIDQILNNFSFYISQIDYEAMGNIEHALSKFYEIESHLFEFITSREYLKYSQGRTLKFLTEDLLVQKFNDPKNKFKNRIENILDNSYETIKTSNEMSKDFLRPHFNFLIETTNDVDVEIIENTFKEIFNTIFLLFKSDLEYKFGSNKLPNFLLKQYKKKIRFKIQSICNPWVKQYHHQILENKIEIKLLKNFVNAFSIGELNIFDEKSIPKMLLENLFDIFYVSNIEYFKTDKNALKLFVQRFAFYYEIFFNQNKELENADIKKEYIINSKLDSLYKNYYDLPSNEITDILKVQIDLMKSILGDFHEKFFFTIFSFSIVLNNLVKFDENKNLVWNEELMCNGRERHFMTNIFRSFKEYFSSDYDPFTLNSYSQSVVIKNILKSENCAWYDEHLKQKEKMTIEKIEHEIFENCHRAKILEKFQKLYSEKFIRTSSLGFFKKIFSSFNRNKIQIDNFSITPLDNYTLSTNACVCISGFTSDGIDQERAWEELAIDLNKYIDIYFLNWPSETKISLGKDLVFFLGSQALNIYTENYIKLFSDIKSYAQEDNIFHKATNTAKMCGKLLAYIIASKSIYRFQTLNLVGFSLGSHLIKHCLLELYNLAKEDSDLENIIQNVVFVAGATNFKNKDKWNKIFDTLVSGRVINCHGDNDNILKHLFKLATTSDAIGHKKLESDSCKVENYDFSELSIDHHEYRKNLSKIIKKIKLY